MRWNITELEVNFTDIKKSQEIISIEEGGSSFKDVSKSKEGYGVQLNITENMALLGVYIYGYIQQVPFSPVYVQINGYDQINNWPNSTIYGNPIPINLSLTPNWYMQKFSEPIFLPKGYYYLVVNGSEYNPSDNSKHIWFLNEDNSNYTSLYTSRLDGTWAIESQGQPFRHKLVLSSDQSINPESINMSLRINNHFYNISDSGIGRGQLEVSNINLPLTNQTDFILPISHNSSMDLLFNLSYSLKLDNFMQSPGYAHISENNDIIWTINPEINNALDKYSVSYNFSSKWSNINVLKDNININGDVEINYGAKYLFIPNTAITEGASWEITATSPKTSFGIDVPRTEFISGQEIKFFISEPSLDGNYTFLLIDPFDDELNRSIKIFPTSSNSFTFALPSSAIDGYYIAYVYWFNGTDGGLITQFFTVIRPFTIDWTMVLIISLLIGMGLAITISSVVMVKKSKNWARAEKNCFWN